MNSENPQITHWDRIAMDVKLAREKAIRIAIELNLFHEKAAECVIIENGYLKSMEEDGEVMER